MVEGSDYTTLMECRAEVFLPQRNPCLLHATPQTYMADGKASLIGEFDKLVPSLVQP